MSAHYGNAAHVYDRGAPTGAHAQGDGFNLKDVVRVLWRRRALISITVILITTLSALTALALPPRYGTVASILIEQGRSRLIDKTATGEAVVEAPTDSRALAAEINLLRSRTYAQKVIEDLDLLSDPGFNHILQGGTPPLTLLAGRLSALSSQVVPEALLSRLPDSWLFPTGFAEQVWPPSDPPGTDEDLAGGATRTAAEAVDAAEPAPPLPASDSDAYEALMQRAVITLLKGLSIRAGGSNTLLIEFTSSDPHLSVQIADKVAELYVRDQLEIKQRAIDEAISWLENRVSELREQVLQSEGAVVAYREASGLIGTSAPQRESGPGRELADIRAERIKKEGLLRWVRELRGQGAELDTIAAVLALPTLAELRQRQMELQRQEAMLRMTYGAQHREIIQLDGGRHSINVERQNLVERVDTEIRAAIRTLEGEIAFARHREQEIESRLEQTAAAEPTSVSRAEVQLRDLERQAEADRSLYVAFLNRFKEVSEQRNLLEAGAQVASRAGLPGEPEFPKPGLMTAGGFMVSLVLGTVLAFLIEYFDAGLRTGRQVERVLGLPNLGFVPRVSGSRRRRRLHRYLIEKPRSGYAEAIRAVQMATVDSVDTGTPTRVVLVTSSLPGEGKTTLALSLGVSAACSGRKAVVVDLDLRRPRLHRETGLEPDAGLVEFMAGEKALDEVLHASGDHPGLDILPVKSLPESPADLLRSPGMVSLIAELRARYDYVVLDSPPLLGVVDAKLAARLADAVLFVARWEKTKEAVARTGLEHLVDRYTPPIGAVLTQVNVRRHAKRGYGEVVQYHAKYEAYYRN